MLSQWSLCALSTAGVILLFARPATGHGEHSGPLSPIDCQWADLDPEATAGVFRKLDQPLPSGGVAFDVTPLGDTVDYLRKTFDLSIYVDQASLDDLGLSVDEPITLHVHGIRLSAALRLLLKTVELTYTVRDGVLVITSRERGDDHLLPAVYPVSDLLLNGDFGDLIELITSTIQPYRWAENGRGEAEIRPFPQRGAIVVATTADVHVEIAALLGSLRKCSVDPEAKPMTQVPTVFATPSLAE